ncbi:MAG: HEAT repeat domain-containing protein [Thermoanaerobaculia bacterium]
MKVRTMPRLAIAVCAAVLGRPVAADEAAAGRAAKVLADTATGKDEGARLFTLEKAPATGIPGLEEAARHSATSSDRTERALALALLARIDVSRNRDLFVEALRSPFRVVRLRALNGLLSLEDPALAPLFVSSLENDPDPDLRALAARGLGLAGLESGREALRKALENGPPVVQRAAVEALVASGDRSSGGRLLERARGASGQERLRLFRLVGLVPDPALVQQLTPLLDDPGAETRAAAAVAILSILEASR